MMEEEYSSSRGDNKEFTTHPNPVSYSKSNIYQQLTHAVVGISHLIHLKAIFQDSGEH